MEDTMENTVILNGKEITLPELEAKKKEIKGKKGVELVESGSGEYRIKIKG